jgi:hypothetical protein
MVVLPQLPPGFLSKTAVLRGAGLELTISGSGMSTMVYSWDVDSFPVEPVLIRGIPAGSGRVFRGVLVNSAGTPVYSGRVASDVRAGDTVMITLRLTAETGSAVVCIEIEGLPSSCSSPDTGTGLLAYFPFDQPSDTFRDATGRWTGVNMGASFVPGYQGNAIQCSQTGYVTLDTILPGRLTSGTVELWIKRGTSFSPQGEYSIFGNRACRVQLFYKDTTLYFLKNHTNIFKWVAAREDFEQGRWYKLAVCWGSHGMRLFVDGQLAASNSDTSDYEVDYSYPVSWYVMQCGYKEYGGMEGIGVDRNAGPFYFDGLIDELKLWSVERY